MIGESLEDFLEAIYSLSAEEWADTEAVAGRLGMKLSGAYVSAGKLMNIGLVEGKEMLRRIRLTPLGLQVAKNVNTKHLAIKTFLVDFLCVPPQVAEDDAHHMEHVISDESLDKIVALLKFIEESPGEYSAWFDRFKGKVCRL